MDGRGPAARFSESYPHLITDSCHDTYFYEEFWRKTTHCLQFLPISGKVPIFKESLPKRDPCLENFEPKSPPIKVPHTCTLNMLSPPGV